MPRSPVQSERLIVFLVGAVQFVNILDFVMVMPLGPDFAQALGIPTSKIGLVGGSYTAAGAAAGLLGSLFLDRFDRRKALGVAMLGLVIGTALGGFAWDLPSLMAARVVAGAFGGPATSLSLSIIADAIPFERRGKAMGAVMGAFSVASVLGVPMGLELARAGGWRAPFWAVAGMGLVLAALAVFFLPPMRGHLERQVNAPRVRARDLFTRPTVVMSYLTTAVVMMAGFVLIPNISAYVQQNLGYPRDRLWLLYFVGGIASFGALRLVGGLVDRHGSFKVGTVGAAAVALTTWVGFIHYRPAIPVLAVFVAFMVAMSFRNVAYNTLASKVPSSHERARFMSFQSAIQHLSSSVGAFLSTRLLSEVGGRLVGIERVGWLSIGLTALAPPLFFLVESRVLARERARMPPHDVPSGLQALGPGVNRPPDPGGKGATPQ